MSRISSQSELAELPPDRELVCYAFGGIYSWDEAGNRGELLVGQDTRSLNDVRIYVTARRSSLYGHSNFVKTGRDWPTKALIRSDRVRVLETLALNLVATEEQAASLEFQHSFRRALAETFVLMLDECLLEPGRYPSLDLAGLRNVFVVDGQGQLITLQQWNERFRMKAKSPEERRPPAPNPWIPGSFYLATLVAFVTTIRVIFGPLHPIAIPAVTLGGLLAVSVVGAFTLRNQAVLQERSFLQLMKMTLACLPLIGRLVPFAPSAEHPRDAPASADVSSVQSPPPAVPGG